MALGAGTRRSLIASVLGLTLGCGDQLAAPTASEPEAAPRRSEPLAAGPDAIEAPEAPTALAISPYWRERAPYVRELANGEWIEVEESWSGDSNPEEPLVGLRVRTRSDERDAHLAVAERFLVERAEGLQYSVSRAAMSAVLDGLTLRASTPGFHPGELWIEANGRGTAAALRHACTVDAPWAEDLRSVSDWRARVVACSTSRRPHRPTLSRVRLHLDAAAVVALREAAGFDTAEACALGQCWRRSGDRPALLQVSEYDVRLTLDPDPPE